MVASVFDVWNGVRGIHVHGNFLRRDIAPSARPTNKSTGGGRTNKLAPRTRKCLLLRLPYSPCRGCVLPCDSTSRHTPIFQWKSCRREPLCGVSDLWHFKVFM